MPQWHYPTSSNVKAVAYEEDTSQLLVSFKSGHTYAYDGVPNGLIDDLLNADSVGKYLNENIKGVYQEKKIS